jgi:hypothetical protein
MDLMMMMMVFAVSSAQKVNQQDKDKYIQTMHGITNHDDDA